MACLDTDTKMVERNTWVTQPQKEKTVEKTTAPSINNLFLDIRLKVWWIFFLVLIVFQFAVMIGLLATNSWVEQGEGDDKRWEGGILKVLDSDIREIDQEPYNEVADEVCDLPSHYGVCEMFEDLRDAGFVFIFYEILALLMVVLWFGQVVFALLEIDCGRAWLGYIWPFLGFVFHFVGLIVYAGLVGISFSDCDTISRLDREVVCGTHGPVLATFITISLLVIGLGYSLVWNNREKKVLTETDA
jgi:hypothetical protein